jgi:hypothetical protein
VSSRNCWCVDVGKFSKGLMHVISLAVVAHFMLLLSPSIIKMNKKGDSESPCLMPLEGQKGLDGAPFIKSEYLNVETKMTIQLI